MQWYFVCTSAEAAPDSEDNDGVWETVRDHGYEGRNDERCNRWCNGRWRGWGWKVGGLDRGGSHRDGSNGCNQCKNHFYWN